MVKGIGCVFHMVTACGKKLFVSLFVLVLLDLYHLPEGSRSNRGKGGMGAVAGDASNSFGAAQQVNVFQGRERAAIDPETTLWSLSASVQMENHIAMQ